MAERHEVTYPKRFAPVDAGTLNRQVPNAINDSHVESTAAVLQVSQPNGEVEITVCSVVAVIGETAIRFVRLPYVEAPITVE